MDPLGTPGPGGDQIDSAEHPWLDDDRQRYPDYSSYYTEGPTIQPSDPFDIAGSRDGERENRMPASLPLPDHNGAPSGYWDPPYLWHQDPSVQDVFDGFQWQDTTQSNQGYSTDIQPAGLQTIGIQTSDIQPADLYLGAQTFPSLGMGDFYLHLGNVHGDNYTFFQLTDVDATGLDTSFENSIENPFPNALSTSQIDIHLLPIVEAEDANQQSEHIQKIPGEAKKRRGEALNYVPTKARRLDLNQLQNVHQDAAQLCAGSSATPINMAKSTGESSVVWLERIDCDRSKPFFHRFAVNITSEKNESARKCLRCTVMGIRCQGGNKPCDSCKKRGCDGCVWPEDIIKLLIIPDLYLKLVPDLPKNPTLPAKDAPKYKAHVFVQSGARNPIVRLNLTVYWDEISLLHSDENHVIEYKVWEDLRRSELMIGWSRMLHCSVPPDLPPSESSILQWVLGEFQKNSSGVIGAFHGPLSEFARLYCHKRDRPLKELINLALDHTAVYNVCLSELSVVLEIRAEFGFRVCPRLKSQIFVPLFRSTGKKLQDSLKNTVWRKRDRPTEDKHLAIAITMWFLILIYQHSLDQVEKAAFLLFENGVQGLDKRQAHLEDFLKYIRKQHYGIFRRAGKPISPLFNENLHGKCDIRVKDKKLKCALLNLQRAMRQHQSDAYARQEILQRQLGGLDAILDDIIGPFINEATMAGEQNVNPPEGLSDLTSAEPINSLADDILSMTGGPLSTRMVSETSTRTPSLANPQIFYDNVAERQFADHNIYPQTLELGNECDYDGSYGFPDDECEFDG